MSDYWYENRHVLNPGHLCILEDGSIVRLNYRVPGDGTDWYVLDYCPKSHSFYDNNGKIHPGDIKYGPQW